MCIYTIRNRAAMWEDWHDIVVYIILVSWCLPCVAESSNTQRLSEMMLTGRAGPGSAVQFLNWCTLRHFTQDYVTASLITPSSHEHPTHAVTSRRFEMYLASKRWWSVWYWSSLYGSYQLLSWSFQDFFSSPWRKPRQLQTGSGEFIDLVLLLQFRRCLRWYGFARRSSHAISDTNIMRFLIEPGLIFYIFPCCKWAYTFEETSVYMNANADLSREICHGRMF